MSGWEQVRLVYEVTGLALQQPFGRIGVMMNDEDKAGIAKIDAPIHNNKEGEPTIYQIHQL